MSGVLDKIRDGVRGAMHVIALQLNQISGGKITPNMVTFFGLLAHIPIAYLIATEAYVLAGVLLIFFGLFDALDGQLARLQKRDGPAGMFLDSVTDRIKEALVYVGLTASLFARSEKVVMVALTIALGSSLITSYVNAWGEVALAAGAKKHKVNKTLRSGLLSFDMRIALIIIGLLLNQIELAIYVIATLASITVLQRISNTLRKL